MPVQVGCPTCGVKLDIPEHFLGKKVRCASCSNVFEATAELAPPPQGESHIEESDDTLPLAPLDEDQAPRRKRRRRPEYYGEIDDYDERYDRDEGRQRRYRRRDLDPHRGGMVLTLGILSLVLPFVCGAPGMLISMGLGPTAWILGSIDLGKMRNESMDPDGEGNTRAGQICGICGTILTAMLLLCCGVYVIFIISVETMKKH